MIAVSLIILCAVLVTISSILIAKANYQIDTIVIEELTDDQPEG